MSIFFRALGVLWFIFLIKEEPLRAQSYRHDLGASLGSSLCPSSTKSPESLWEFGVWDASLQGGVVYVPKRKELEKKIAHLARQKDHHGYGFYPCGNNRYWYLTAPSASPFVIKNQKLQLPLASLKKHCKSHLVEFAPWGQAHMKEIEVRGSTISLAPLGKGTLSVRCQPREPSRSGPVVWALISLGVGPQEEIPFEDFFKKNPRSLTSFEQWLKKLREHFQLPSLVRDQKLLDKSAETMGENNSHLHDRRLRDKAQYKIRDLYHLLGDNKVEGTSLREMARLLWLSPSHRRLLFNKEASHWGLHLKPLSGRQLLVFVLAKLKKKAS